MPTWSIPADAPSRSKPIESWYASLPKLPSTPTEVLASAPALSGTAYQHAIHTLCVRHDQLDTLTSISPRVPREVPKCDVSKALRISCALPTHSSSLLLVFVFHAQSLQWFRSTDALQPDSPLHHKFNCGHRLSNRLLESQNRRFLI